MWTFIISLCIGFYIGWRVGKWHAIEVIKEQMGLEDERKLQ